MMRVDNDMIRNLKFINTYITTSHILTNRFFFAPAFWVGMITRLILVIDNLVMMLLGTVILDL